MSTRDTINDAFGPPLNLNNVWPNSSINTSGPDGSPYLSLDWPAMGSKLYYTANESARGDIWEVTWVPDPIIPPGDSNLDGQFDANDIILALGHGKYETGEFATWGEGDWNGAPNPNFTISGGTPPPGDGFFTSADIILALATRHYEQGTYAARTTSPNSQATIASAAHANGTAHAAADAMFTRIGGRALAMNEANVPVPEQDHARQLRMRSVSAEMQPFRFRQTRAHIDMAEVPLWSPLPVTCQGRHFR